MWYDILNYNEKDSTYSSSKIGWDQKSTAFSNRRNDYMQAQVTQRERSYQLQKLLQPNANNQYKPLKILKH